jgi:Uma2 family endonuclease
VLEILEIPDIRRQVAAITIERYHRMIELGVFDEWPVELLNGVLVEKMSKSELHLFVVQFLFQQLVRFCPEEEFLVRKEDPLTIGNSEPEPDLSVVEGRLEDFRHTKPTTARFVVEVAISSIAIDRAKTGDYARAGVPECWIVLPQEGRTEVYRCPGADKYGERVDIPAETRLESSARPGFSFQRAELRA